FVRLRVEETPVFAAVKDQARRRVPLADVLRHHPKPLVLGVGVGLAAFVVQGTLTTYLIAYGVQVGFTRQTVLNGLTLSSALAVIGILGWSALSDRMGRRPIVIAGALVMAVFSFALFPMVNSGSAAVLTLALVIGQSVIHPMMYGPLAALYAELFRTQSRYTGASLGYQLSGLAAGLAPVIFAQIAAATGNNATNLISATMAAFCLLTAVCTLTLRETSRQDLTASGVPPGGADRDQAASATA